jgi:anti-sigma factor RsiW
MKCSDVSSLLVDFLYEEMPEAERRDFLAHVEDCPACSAGVKAMSSTLGHARAALRGPLDEDPPARVRARVLAAAQAAAAATVPDSARPRVSRAPAPEGFFARLWNTPWLIPALGAASVATAVFLVKVIKNPPVLPEQRSAVTEMPTQPAATPRPETERERAVAPTEPALGVQGLRMRDGESTLGSKRASHAGSRSEREASADKPGATLPSHYSLAVPKRRLDNDALAGVAWEEQARAPAGEATAAKGGGRAIPPGNAFAAAKARRAPAPAMHAEKDEANLNEVSRSQPQPRKGLVAEGAGSSGRWAEPPPPRPAQGPIAAAPAPVASVAASAPAELPPAKKAKAVADLEQRSDHAARMPMAGSAERAKSQVPARAAPSGYAAQAEAPADKETPSESKQAIPFEERVRKAEKLFAEKKWAEAAAAFRALLAQAPADPAAKTWRERVAAADLAQEQARAARAKKAVSSDPLDGL